VSVPSGRVEMEIQIISYVLFISITYLVICIITESCQKKAKN